MVEELLLHPTRAQLRAELRARRAALKPGEVLDRGTGEVRDVVEGEIRLRRAP